MSSTTIQTDVLIIGGGTGGTAAAIQSARRGAQTILVTDGPWLGGMLTAAGVTAPDGNELVVFQTGLWGAFLRALRQRQTGGLDHAWVSFFTYEPKVGAAIFADWVRALPSLQWIHGKSPKAVIRKGDRIYGAHFDDLTIHATLTLDGTELGDVLELADIPHRWGWENRQQFSEPSAPQSISDPEDPLYPVVQKYPIQAPTWVVTLQDAGADTELPMIAPTADYDAACFEGAWDGYGPDAFINYGRLPGQQFMLNWPQCGNDYGQKLHLLLQGETARREWSKAAIAHSRNFAHFIQHCLGRRYGLAFQTFPQSSGQLGGGAFALIPYYRESRRLIGIQTVTEKDILPLEQGEVAALPRNARGEMSAVAMGNYPNDHHYPGFDFPLLPKARHWGGRWTGTPFTIPYEALLPATVDGLLVCDKNISVSHIANGATRLQPVILGIGQAAGMAAALCVEQACQPRELTVAALQQALIDDPVAPAAVVPLFDCLPQSAEWRSLQHHFCQQPETYPKSGEAGTLATKTNTIKSSLFSTSDQLSGTIKMLQTGQQWQAEFRGEGDRALKIVTLYPQVHDLIKNLKDTCTATLRGYINPFAGWIQVLEITVLNQD